LAHRAHSKLSHSSHHSSTTARRLLDDGSTFVVSQPSSGGLDTQPSVAYSSQPTSQVNSPPDAAQLAASRGLVELALPPPANRPSPTQDTSSRSSPADTSSVMLDAQFSTSAPITTGTSQGTSILSQAANAGDHSNVLHSAIFTPASVAASVLLMASNSSNTTPPPLSRTEIPSMHVDVSASIAGNSNHLSSVVMSPSQTTISPGIPAAVGAACAVTGALVLAGASNSPTPLSPATGSPTHVTSLPPMQHCYSDGSRPDSIMDDDASASAYYQRASVGLPPLIVPTTAVSSSGQHSASSTAPTTPTQSMAPFVFNVLDADLKPSPPNDMLSPEMQLPFASSSAHTSPAVQPPGQGVYERRYSTPQLLVPASARQLFPDSTQHTPQQATLDELGRSAPDAAGPSPQRMDTDYMAQSVPMQPQAHVHFASPPPLVLPPRIGPSGIHVRIGESSGSESERADEDQPSMRGSHLGARPAHAHAYSRSRAYSQDESCSLMEARHPADSVMSNVQTPQPAQPAPLPHYSISPRFHRQHFTPTPDSNRRTSIASSRAAAQPKPPPSPQNKKSWFSTGIMNLMDKVRGVTKRSSAHATPTSSSAVHMPASPLLSPAGAGSSSTPRGNDSHSFRMETKLATLTVSNELLKLFREAGLQFTIQKGYRMEASYQPSAMEQGLDNFSTPPMPPPMPSMQRAVSTPAEQHLAQRPRSSSIAIEPTSRPAERTLTCAVPSTPLPTPTRVLNRPVVLQSVPQYPLVEPGAELSADESMEEGLLQRNPSNTSSASTESAYDSSTDAAAMTDVLPTSSVTSVGPASSPPLPASGGSSRPNSARPRSSAPLFGPLGCRFSVEVVEAEHDTRVVSFTRKSGDATTFQRICSFVQPQLHA
jgi:hypothetical protein